MPAFRTSPHGRQSSLDELPCTCVQDGQKIGRVLNRMRTGHTTIPIQFIAELEVLGYNEGRSIPESRFQIDYMPAFRASTFGHKNRLWETNATFVQDGQKIGKVLTCMRTGKTTIPLQFIAELETLGYNGGRSIPESRFQVDYMPAFRTSPHLVRRAGCGSYHGHSSMMVRTSGSYLARCGLAKPLSHSNLSWS